ncbi:uncharacterized protein LOC130934500 [Arachis stenosperma]|uniref:uncharacterized protein LOC130934500 n=1 Tax=Arachis stenosperma TaxID=217475 RepID=UPI0025ACF6B0|nr:uncharacterized protein LOC130934500 [Arachis stenosperma]
MTLAAFLKVNLPTFRGTTNPTEADNWFQAVEHALQTQHVPDTQFVEFANVDIPWKLFRATFYRKYFPESVRDARELELMQLKQDSEILLVNKARVIEDNAKKVALAWDTHGGNNNQGRRKHFQPRAHNFKRGGHASQYPQGQKNFRRANYDQFHQAKRRVGCFTYGFSGHMSRDCPHGRNQNVGQNQQQDRVFAMNANDIAKSDPLMTGKCLIGDKTLIALYDTRASHSFIVFDKVVELGLKILDLAFDLHGHTPSQTVVTRLGYRQIPSKIEDRSFVHDLIYLSMAGLEIILGFDWLSKNRVLSDSFK